jgi:hypothetical protein
MASSVFTQTARSFATGKFDFSTLNTSTGLKTLLVSSVPSEANLDAWANRSDVTNEITGTGYTAGGVNQAFTFNAIDTTNNRQSVSLTNLAPGWTSSTFTAVGAVVYKNTGTSTTDTLLEFIDFGGSFTCTAGTFTINYTSDLLINRV